MNGVKELIFPSKRNGVTIVPKDRKRKPLEIYPGEKVIYKNTTGFISYVEIGTEGFFVSVNFYHTYEIVSLEELLQYGIFEY